MGNRLAAVFVVGVLSLALAGTAAAGTVTPVSPMPSSLYYSSAATLTDGRVLVVGAPSGTGLLPPELFDPGTGSWAAAADLPTGLDQATVVPLPGDRAFVLGRPSGSQPSAEIIEIYDAKANTWTATTPGIELGDATAAALPNGRVLVSAPVGGDAILADADGTQARTELYDPATNKWTAGAPLPESFAGVATTLADGRVMVLGPRPRTYTDITEFYTASTDTWAAGPEVDGVLTNATPLPDGRVALAGFSLPNQSTEAIYDPLSNSYQYGGDLATAFSVSTLAPLAGGAVLVTGTARTAEYGPWGPQADEWQPTPRGNPASVLQPKVSGSSAVGETLTAETVDTGPLPHTIQWQRCASTCVDVGPTTTVSDAGNAAAYSLSPPTYTLTNADIGAQIQFVVTVTDGTQTETATSAPTSLVTPLTYTVGSPAGAAVVSWTGPQAGNGVITVTRNSALTAGTVNYQLTFAPTGPVALYPPVAGTLIFPAKTTQRTIVFPATDHGVRLLAGTVTVTLSSPSSGVIASPASTTLPLYPDTVLGAYTPVAGNPLGLRAMPGADPLSGASFFHDPDSLVARVAWLWRKSNPVNSSVLESIARQPSTARFGAWDGDYPGGSVASYLNRAASQEPGTIPMISTYRIVDGQCHNGDDTPADAAAYATWIRSLAEGIGIHPAVLFLEMDSLITTPCLNAAGLAIRLGELRDAVAVLSDDPHLVIYLDAGAADALPAARAATLLGAAGVADTAGFYLNSTHFDWTRHEITYGERISRLIGGKHFVVNTAENGRGPLIPKNRRKHGNEVLCNPPGRGLGPLPTSSTGYANVDAFAWIANPGVSGGRCRAGAPATGRFWPALALQLAAHANVSVN